MEWMVFDSALNIFALVMLMGLGVVALLMVIAVFITALGILEDS